MNNKFKLVILCSLCCSLLFLSVYFFLNNQIKYAAVCVVFTFCVCSYTYNFFVVSFGSERFFDTRVNKILGTYDSILARGREIPELDDKDIIYVEKMNDLVDVQIEVRKPICYFRLEDSCSFILVDDKQAYIHDEKKNDSVVSALDNELRKIKQVKKNNESGIDPEILKNLEHTTIIQLSDKNSYKISPIRKKNNKNTSVIIEKGEFEEKNVELLDDVLDDVETLDILDDVEFLD